MLRISNNINSSLEYKGVKIDFTVKRFSSMQEFKHAGRLAARIVELLNGNDEAEINDPAFGQFREIMFPLVQTISGICSGDDDNNVTRIEDIAEIDGCLADLIALSASAALAIDVSDIKKN